MASKSNYWCDVCGKEIGYWSRQELRIHYNGPLGGILNDELCPSCADDLRKVIRAWAQERRSKSTEEPKVRGLRAWFQRK